MTASKSATTEPTRYGQVSARSFARNSIINFSGQVLVAIAGFTLLPLTVRHLGPDRYGLIAIAFVLLGSFTLVEMGLGRAATNFVATAISEHRYEEIPALVWTSSLFQAAIGLIIAIPVACASAFVVGTLHISKQLSSDARMAIIALAFCAPFVLATSSLRGALEGAQCFAAVNAIKCTVNVAMYAVPALFSLRGYSVAAIIEALLIVRIFGAVAFFSCCVVLLPKASWTFRLMELRELKRLVSYSGWVAISNCIVPFLVQIDRYLIGAIVSVAAVTYYALPFELMNGLWIVPASMAAVLFPGFSSFKSGDTRLSELFIRSTKYILLLLGIAVSIVCVFAFDILRIWQGGIIAARSHEVLIVLSLGVLMNSIGWVPANFLLGRGRPDIPAKIHMVQAPIYLAGAFLMIRWFGILGAALAFSLRVGAESAALFSQAARLSSDSVRFALRRSLPTVFALLSLAGSLALTRHTLKLPYAANVSAIMVFLFCGLAWRFLLDPKDRALVVRKQHGRERTLSLRGTRVLHVGAEDGPGGVAQYISSMLPEFVAHGIQCHITVSPQRVAQPSLVFPDPCLRHGYSVTYRPWSIPSSAIKLRRLLKREQIDLLHLHTARAGLIGAVAAIGSGIPIIYTGHGLRFEQKASRASREIFRLYEKLICSLADRSTMLTRRDRRIAIRSRVVAQQKSRVLGTRIQVGSAPKDDCATLLRDPADNFVIGTVGSINERKDPYTFLRAAKLVAEELPSASFVWVGDGELRTQVGQIARDLGISERLTITGNVPHEEVHRWLQKMSVFVFSSRNEGFPLSVLEAFANQVPVVCSRYTGSGWYLMAKSEHTALTFAVGDSEACARQVLRFAQDEMLRKKIVTAGRELFASDYCGPSTMAQEYLQVYSQLVVGTNRERM